MEDVELTIKKAMVIGALNGIYTQLTVLALEVESGLSIVTDLDKTILLVETMRDQLEEEISSIDEDEEEVDDYEEDCEREILQ